MRSAAIVLPLALAWAASRAAPPEPMAPIRLQDVAREAGLDFVHENSPTPRKHLIETMPGGVAVFDYDGDGRLDVFFTNGAAVPGLEKDAPRYRNRLFRNEGDLKFTRRHRGRGPARARATPWRRPSATTTTTATRTSSSGACTARPSTATPAAASKT